MFLKIVYLLNWIKTNLFANMGLDVTVIIYSCTDSVWYWRCSASSAVLFYVLSHKLTKLLKQI